MERYVRGEETWTDNIEKHKDNGKGHMFCRPYMSAAAINIFDPENPLIKPLRDNALDTIDRNKSYSTAFYYAIFIFSVPAAPFVRLFSPPLRN